MEKINQDVDFKLLAFAFLEPSNPIILSLIDRKKFFNLFLDMLSSQLLDKKLLITFFHRCQFFTT
jgi:hypothetical protein